MTESQRFKEIEVERILLREPKEGRVRAVLETAPPRGPDSEVQVPAIRLTLLTPTGESALVAEVDESGAPTLYVGDPDRGTTIAIAPGAIDLWSGGNIVATLRSTGDGGELELLGADGTVRVALPGL